MSARVWTCTSCGWRGVAVGGRPCVAGQAPAACGRCGAGSLTVASVPRPKVDKACGDCGTWFGPVDPSAKWCPACRWRHRGKRGIYVWTPARDQIVRERYDGRKRRCGDEIGRTLGVPGWAVRKRAAYLGLTNPWPRDRRVWTVEEIRFLEEHAGARHVNWIAKRLKRGLTSVVVKMKRLGISQKVREGYTLRALEPCFGVDHRIIERWVREGKLQVHKLGTARERDFWHVSEDAVRKFIRTYPTAFDLRKVEQLWFMDLMLGTRLLAADTDGAAA